MELTEGLRITVQTDEGASCVAVIDDLTDEGLEATLLEDFDGHVVADTAVTVFVPDGGGLHYWPAQAMGPSMDRRLALAFVGPHQVVQRRRHPRYAVDLQAEVNRVPQGPVTRPDRVRIVDLSHGGARVVGTSALATGDTFVLNVDLGNGMCTTGGRVAMAYPDGQGGRISHLSFSGSAEAFDEIDRYIRNIQADELAST